MSEVSPVNSSEISAGTPFNGALMKLLLADDIQPGSDPSYQLCKTIYMYHPLGQKMAEAPIKMAQSQSREITVQDAPDEVRKAFEKEWAKLSAETNIANVMRLSRIYGIAAIVAGVEGFPSDKPIDMPSLWKKHIYFNVLDPLNTSGSLVLSQESTSPHFNKPVSVTTSGEEFHRSRYQVVMNEAPIFLGYTSSAFGYTGRSVYQRALYPLKSFVRSMIADDMIATKLALLVAKQKPPGSTISRMMERVAAVKRTLLKVAQTGNVLTIDTEEDIETLNMQNVDGAGNYARGNILKNVATAADMPALLLENETMVEGFGEGTEDAKAIIRYLDGVRKQMQPVYAWFDNIVQYRAWNPDFYQIMQAKYPSQYPKRKSYDEAFSEWRDAYAATWPSLLIEPESEKTKVEQTKSETIVSLLQTLLPEVDPGNKSRAIQWALDNLSENKLLFPHDLVLDYDELEQFQKKQQKQLDKAAKEGRAAGAAPGGAGGAGAKAGGKGLPAKVGRIGGR